MDATCHITTLLPTVSGRQPRALAPHPTLRLLGESAQSASTRPNSACRNVKHKRRCRLHLFRGPRPTPFSSFLTSLLTVSADSPRKKDGVAGPGLSIEPGAPSGGSTWPPLAVSSVFHLDSSMSCSWGHIVMCQVLCDKRPPSPLCRASYSWAWLMGQKPPVVELVPGHPGNRAILLLLQ